MLFFGFFFFNEHNDHRPFPVFIPFLCPPQYTSFILFMGERVIWARLACSLAFHLVCLGSLGPRVSQKANIQAYLKQYYFPERSAW